MRFHDPLEDILRGRTSLRVLKTLLRFPTKSFTGRELARTAKVLPADANSALRRLLDHGFVQRHVVGRANVWTLNRRHFLLGPLRSLVQADDGSLPALRELIQSTLKSQPGVERALLFGSVAKGTERPNSDIDLLVIVDSEATRRRVRGLMKSMRERIEATFTNPLAEIIYTRRAYLHRRKLPLVINAEREGILVWEKRDADLQSRPGKSRNLPR